MARASTLLGGLVLLIGLAAAAPALLTNPRIGFRSDRSGAEALALDLNRTRPLGLSPGYRLAPRRARAAAALPVDGLRCGGRRAPAPYGAHVELFAADRVLAVPAGIGWAPPLTMVGARVGAGRCAYPLRTDDPAGLVIVDPSRVRAPTVGVLFAIWGQPLDAHHLAGFASRTPLRAFLDGRRWGDDPRTIPLGRHAQVELELGAPVDPHPRYAFPGGL